MNTKTWLILGGLIACVLITYGVVHALSSGIAVDTARVKRGPIREFVDERAITRLPETHLITMPFAGRIEDIDLKEGTAVKKGEVVAQIVPADMGLALEQATAVRDRLDASIRENADVEVEEIAFKQALQFAASMGETVKVALERVASGRDKFKYAEENLGRIRQSAAGGAHSKDDLEQAKLREKLAGHELTEDLLIHAATEAMEAATDLMPTMIRQFIIRKTTRTAEVLLKQKAEAEVRLRQVVQDGKRSKMESPADGVVLKRSISNERFLSAGQTLLEIGHLEDLEIEADVLSLDVVGAEAGDPVEIYGPAIGPPDVRARGAVKRIYPAGFTKISSLGVEQQRVKVIIGFDPEDLDKLLGERRLGVGYRVRVKIITAEKPDALIVPRSALFRGTASDDTGGSWQVYAIRNGRAEIRKVKVGLINDQWVEVLSKLSEGERVVLAPESNLTGGARVTVEKKGK